MHIVLDANVLVSALLFSRAHSGVGASGAVVLCADARILAEYEEVLLRPEFGFDATRVCDLLDFITREAVPVQGVASLVSGPDSGDMPFVEVCLAGPATCVVTGNFKHFTPAIRKVVRVMSPKEFVETFLRSSTGGRSDL